MTKQKITILSKKDLEISYFCGSGAGGQARNKVASGVNMIHKESGAVGRACDSRSQNQNKRAAFERLLKTPKFKFWLSKKLFEIREGEKLEEQIERELKDFNNIKYEIKIDGKWAEVKDDYFNSENAKKNKI